MELTSDHISVFLKLSLYITQKQQKAMLVNKTKDWDPFRANLDKTITLVIRLRISIEIGWAV